MASVPAYAKNKDIGNLRGIIINEVRWSTTVAAKPPTRFSQWFRSPYDHIDGGGRCQKSGGAVTAVAAPNPCAQSSRIGEFGFSVVHVSRRRTGRREARW